MGWRAGLRPQNLCQLLHASVSASLKWGRGDVLQQPGSLQTPPGFTHRPAVMFIPFIYKNVCIFN